MGVNVLTSKSDVTDDADTYEADVEEVNSLVGKVEAD